MGVSLVAVSCHHPFLLMILLTFFTVTSSSSIQSLVYCGCSQYRYTRGSTYETNVNSMLTSLVNSAISAALYNQFTIPAASAATPDTVSSVFQCRGDLSSADCFNCISSAVTQLGTVCLNSVGGAMQLQGCFIKYDNSSFLGIEDKTVLFKKCGSVVSSSDAIIAKRDSVLAYIGSDIDGTNKPYRYYSASASGGTIQFQAMGQCVQHIDNNKCQDCLTEAIRQLKTTCAASKSGDMFLGTCYVRYSSSNNDFSTSPSHRVLASRSCSSTVLLLAFISLILLLAHIVS